jgi:hypothetical protein
MAADHVPFTSTTTSQDNAFFLGALPAAKELDNLLKVPCAETERALCALKQSVEELRMLLEYVTFGLIWSSKPGRPMTSVTYKTLSAISAHVVTVKECLGIARYSYALLVIARDLPDMATVERKLSNRMVNKHDKQNILKCLGAVYTAAQQVLNLHQCKH